MDIKEIYWLAGFLDGEGCFGINNTPQIQVSSIDLDLLEKCKSIMWSTSGIYLQADRSPTGNPIYKYTICGPKAIQWMMTIYSLMCQRRKQRIREVIEYWKKMKLANENKTLCPKGHSLAGRNLVIETSGVHIVRRCRICKNLNHKNYLKRNKETYANAT